MKKLLMMMAFWGLAFSAAAVPAKRVNRTVRLNDGTVMTVQLRGDETFHYWVSPDGVAVRQDEHGEWMVDHRDVKMLHQKALETRNYERQRLAPKMRKSMRAVRAPYRMDATITKKGLVILVNFKDKAMSHSNTKEIFNQMLNGLNNPYGKNKGSVREYFRAQSYNQFDVEFDIAGPVTLSNNMEYYGKNDSNGDDLHPGEMIKEACQLVNSQINFADYDWDGDGEVENIYVTYAGYGEASGAPSNTVYPHQWALSSATGSSLNLDGVVVDTYACGSELYGITGTTIDGVGTMCHEYSHCLGLPDFYDTEGSNFGMDVWSLMDYGCYNGDGYCPAGYTAYERWYSGWLEPVVLSESCVVKEMKNIEQNPEAYILYNDNNKNEYYMLANHQQIEWDKEAAVHGLMIMHVDYNSSAWINNVVNNTTNHQRMTIIPADNLLTTSSISNDLWPRSKKTELTDTSTPAATTYNNNIDGKKLMHKPITNISESNGLISFSFMGDIPATTIDAPVLDGAKDVTNTGFKAQWSKVQGALSYNLTYTEQVESGDVFEALNLIEDFESFYVDEDETADGSKDISAELDSYTYDPGWTGTKIYQGIFGAKMGSSSAKGLLTSPVIQGTTGSVTLYLVLSDWFNYKTLMDKGIYKYDGASVTISVMDANGTLIKSQTVDPGKISDEGEFFIEPAPIVMTIDGVPSEYKISLQGSKRIYAMYFLSFDGRYSQDEIETLFEEDEEEYASVRMRGQKQLRTARRSVLRRAAAEPVVIENITATEYILSNLTEGATYSFQVQAVDAEGNVSVWSNVESVTLGGTNVSVRNLEESRPAAAKVFDLAGRHVRASVRGGIYVIDGRKVVIK